MGRYSRAVLPTCCLTALSFLSAGQQPSHKPEKQYISVLKQIHAEVKEMGPYPGHDFYQQAFFVGEDDDDTNKDIHVSILIRAQGDKERMTIRVTRMRKDRRNPQARLAETTKELICLVGEDAPEIQSSDYEEREIVDLVPEILTAIRNKKRLLKLGTVYHVPDLVFAEVGA